MLYFYFHKLFRDENKKKEQSLVLAKYLNQQDQSKRILSGLCSIVRRLWRRRSGVFFFLVPVKSRISLKHLTLSIISATLTKHFNVTTFR